MNKVGIFSVLCLALMTTSVWGQTTYTWQGADNADWTVSTNWNPTRSSPASSDILQFNTGTTLTVTNVPTQTGGRLLLSSSTNITLQSASAVTLTVGNGTGDDLVIGSGSSLILDSSVNLTIATNATADISGTLTVNSGRTFSANNSGVLTTVSGTLTNKGSVSGSATKLSFASGGKYQHAQNGGTIPTASWNANSACEITGVTNTRPSSGASQSFGHFTYNSPDMTTDISLGTGFAVSPNVLQGNLTIQNTGSYSVYFTSTSEPAGNTINGSLVMNGGNLKITHVGGANRTVNVSGNFSMTTGTLDMADTSLIGTLNIAGNFSHTGGTITRSSGSGTGNINFSGTGTQTYTSGGTVTNAVNFTVNSGATLYMASDSTTITGGGTFTLSSGATLGITSSAGITSSGASGNIQVTGTRTYSTGANYTYNGTAAQVTGNGLPSTVNNLTINNSAGVTLTSSVTVSSTLIITSGTFDQGISNTLTAGAISVGSGATFKNFGSGSSSQITLAGNISNSGTIQIEAGSAACGSTDIPIRSGVDGTPRTWSGSGTFLLKDVDLKDQNNTSSSINVYHGTDSGNNTGFTFSSGCYPTAVGLISFSGTDYDGAVLLQWRTGYEVNNLGFHVYREQGGQWFRLTPSLVAGSALLAGAGTVLSAGFSYSWWDDSALSPQPSVPGGVRYWLEDVDLSGKRTFHGPVIPQVSNQPMPKKNQAMLIGQLGREQSEKDRAASRDMALQARLEKSSSSVLSARSLPKGEVLVIGVDTGNGRGTLRSSALGFSDRPGKAVRLPDGREERLTPQEVQWVLAGLPAVKIFVREDGWHRVTQQDLVAAGLDSKVNPSHLQLYVDGEEQAMAVKVKKDGQFGPQDALEFYGTGVDTPFTDTRVYWLVAGARPGKRVPEVGGGQTGDVGPASFPFTVEKKPRTLYVAVVKNGDTENFYGPVVRTEPVEQVLIVSHKDPTPPGEATLEVALQGVTEGTHRVKILLNNVEVGTLVFEGQSRGITTLQISQAYLMDGENRVTLVALGGETDISLMDTIRLTYWHTYTADNDTLRFTASGGQQVWIDGFSSSQVRVVDITDPKVVREVFGKIKAQASGYGVEVVVPGSGQRTLLAFSEGRIERPAALQLNQPSRWYQSGWVKNLVIITHSMFQESLSPLKALRQGQGWSIALIDVEDLYDEFSFGHKSPQAIKDFLSRTRSHWQRAPRFIMLVGDASVDPRNYLGVGSFDFVPTKLIDTTYLETASDDWFVDFNSDGLPDMAIGRLPVRTLEEANVVVSKIVGYEQSSGRLREVLLVADMSGGGDDYDFEAASTGVRALVPAGLTVSSIYRSQFGDDVQVHQELLRGFNEGKLLVNYLGHGSVEVWRGEIFRSPDAEALTNGYRLPFVVSMTCLNGFFHDLYTESLAEALLKAEQGGALAVWASSGLTEPDGQVLMNKELVRLLFNGQSLTIGEATARAKAAVQDGDVRRSWILFGDPTTRLK